MNRKQKTRVRNYSIEVEVRLKTKNMPKTIA